MTVRIEVGISLNAVLTSTEAQALNDSERQQLEALFTAAAQLAGTAGVLSERDLGLFEKTALGKDPGYGKVVLVLDALVKPGSVAPRSLGVAVDTADGSDFDENMTTAASRAADAITNQLSKLPASERQAAIARWGRAGKEVVGVRNYALTLSGSDKSGHPVTAKTNGTGFNISGLTISSGGTTDLTDPYGVRTYLTKLMAEVARAQVPKQVDGVARLDGVSFDRLELAIPVPALSHAPTTR